jgi:uncharacterized UPF0160 family protein
MSTPLTIVTHDGTFHTDDVFACAALSLAFKEKEVEIVRSREEVQINAADIVVDVGGVYDLDTLRFDHHQREGAGVRENGVPYASFGLVWKQYGTMICDDEEIATLIDERLVQGIDGPDNAYGDKLGGKFYTYTISDVIIAQRPTWEEEHYSSDEAFIEAVTLATQVLVRTIAHTRSFVHAKILLEQAYEKSTDKRILVADKEYPGWMEFSAQHEAIQYFIYQRQNGAWSVKAVRKDPADFELRKPFPQAWAGLRDEELQAVTGVPGAIFSHKGGFLVAAKTFEDALQLASIAVES